jgi:hypothetical protein
VVAPPATAAAGLSSQGELAPRPGLNLVASALRHTPVVHGNDWVDEVAAQPRSGANGRSSPAPISRPKGFEGDVPEATGRLPHRNDSDHPPFLLGHTKLESTARYLGMK